MDLLRSPTLNPMELSGRHMPVTAASSGTGRAIAVLPSSLGAAVTIGGRDPGRLDARALDLVDPRSFPDGEGEPFLRTWSVFGVARVR